MKKLEKRCPYESTCASNRNNDCAGWCNENYLKCELQKYYREREKPIEEDGLNG